MEQKDSIMQTIASQLTSPTHAIRLAAFRSLITHLKQSSPEARQLLLSLVASSTVPTHVSLLCMRSLIPLAQGNHLDWMDVLHTCELCVKVDMSEWLLDALVKTLVDLHVAYMQSEQGAFNQAWTKRVEQRAHPFITLLKGKPYAWSLLRRYVRELLLQPNADVWMESLRVPFTYIQMHMDDVCRAELDALLMECLHAAKKPRVAVMVNAFYTMDVIRHTSLFHDAYSLETHLVQVMRVHEHMTLVADEPLLVTVSACLSLCCHLVDQQQAFHHLLPLLHMYMEQGFMGDERFEALSMVSFTVLAWILATSPDAYVTERVLKVLDRSNLKQTRCCKLLVLPLINVLSRQADKQVIDTAKALLDKVTAMDVDVDVQDAHKVYRCILCDTGVDSSLVRLLYPRHLCGPCGLVAHLSEQHQGRVHARHVLPPLCNGPGRRCPDPHRA
jgi:hypothetical protein